jgi:23S rRNA (adenine2503-C2)-methyltransferase
MYQKVAKNNLIDVIKSKVDNTVKYVFNTDDGILEFSYINKNDGKDIICVPSQTSCNLGCKFCHLTGLNLPVRVVANIEYYAYIRHIVDSLKNKNPILLISFMGCGEPLLNLDCIMVAAGTLRDHYIKEYKTVRFAMSSLVPNWNNFKRFQRWVIKDNLLFKFHYSLHTTDEDLRKQLMPAAKPTRISLIEDYVNSTHNSAEIHYTLIDGVNDKEIDSHHLICLLQNKPISVKLLKFNEKNDVDLKGSDSVFRFKKELEDGGLNVEYYEPPGADIGASCGQFLLDYYK